MRHVFIQPTPVSTNPNKTPQRGGNRQQQPIFAVPASRPSNAANMVTGTGSRHSMAPMPRTPRNNDRNSLRPSINFGSVVQGNRLAEEPQFGAANNPRGSILASLGRLSTVHGSISGRGSLAVPNTNLGNARAYNIPKQQQITLDRASIDAPRIRSKIVEYFSLYPHEEVTFAVTEKTVLVPSSQDFVNMFEFLYRQIDPGFTEIGKNMADVVQQLVSALGYPYPLKRTYFMPLGAGHSWPFLLALLNWLIDLVEVSRDLQADYEGKQEMAAWAYFITSYNDRRETGQNDHALMLDTYRNMVSQDSMENEYDQLKARRVLHDRNIKQLQQQTKEENEATKEIDEEMAVIAEDIKSLNDYIDKILVQNARFDEVLADTGAAITRYGAKLAEVNEKNDQTELLIASQTVSGEEARRLMTCRKNLRSQVNQARSAYNRSEQRMFELQPTAFELVNQLRNQYKSFLTKLHELADQLLGAENAAQLRWSDYDALEPASEEFLDARAGQTQVLLEVVNRLKVSAEEGMEEMRQSQLSIALNIEEEQRLISDKDSERKRLESDHHLRVERVERQVEDGRRRAKEAQVELEVVQTQHQRIKGDLSGLLAKVGDICEKVAGAEKRYYAEKNELMRLYSEVVAAMLDKLNLLYEKFGALQHHKKSLMELAQRILEKNTLTIKELKGQL